MIHLKQHQNNCSKGFGSGANCIVSSTEFIAYPHTSSVCRLWNGQTRRITVNHSLFAGAQRSAYVSFANLLGRYSTYLTHENGSCKSFKNCMTMKFRILQIVIIICNWTFHYSSLLNIHSGCCVYELTSRQPSYTYLHEVNNKLWLLGEPFLQRFSFSVTYWW